MDEGDKSNMDTCLSDSSFIPSWNGLGRALCEAPICKYHSDLFCVAKGSSKPLERFFPGLSLLLVESPV